MSEPVILSREDWISIQKENAELKSRVVELEKKDVLLRNCQFSLNLHKTINAKNKAHIDGLQKVADICNQFKWPEARESGEVWEELYQALNNMRKLYSLNINFDE